MEIVIVTGCSGRIGRKVCLHFMQQGFSVIGFDLHEPGLELANIDYIEVDLTSDESVRTGFDYVRRNYGERIHSIIHLAGYYSFDVDQSELYDKLNLRGTGRLLEYAKNFQTEQFIYLSTIYVYNPTYPGKKISENSTLYAQWAYPRSIIRTENLIHKLRGHIPILVIRAASCYDNECHSILIANEIQRIYEHKLTSRFFPGDIHHGISYLHIEDLTQALFHAVHKRAELAEESLLVVGEGKTMSYDAMQRSISKLIDGKEMHTFRLPKWFAKSGSWALNHVPFTESHFQEPWNIDYADNHYELDISRARFILGWVPKHFVGSTLPYMIEFLKKDPLAFYEANGLSCPSWLEEKSKQTANV